MSIRRQMKVMLVTQDDENFLCIREFYCNDLQTGQLLDGKNYQGRTFKLVKDEDDEQGKLLQEGE